MYVLILAMMVNAQLQNISLNGQKDKILKFLREKSDGSTEGYVERKQKTG